MCYKSFPPRVFLALAPAVGLRGEGGFADGENPLFQKKTTPPPFACWPKGFHPIALERSILTRYKMLDKNKFAVRERESVFFTAPRVVFPPLRVG